MSQRTLLLGGVNKGIVTLPAPSVFAPATVQFDYDGNTRTMLTSENQSGAITVDNGTEYLIGWWAHAFRRSGGNTLARMHLENSDGVSGGVFARHDWAATENSRGGGAGAFRVRSGESAWSNRYSVSNNTVSCENVKSGLFSMETSDMGVEDQDWFHVEGFGSEVLFSGDDTDQFFTGDTFTIKSTEEYLVLWSCIADNDDAGNNRHNQRFEFQIDGVGVDGVRTGNTTGGATRTGRGYSRQHVRAGDFSLGGAAWVTLLNGTHTPRFVFNMHENAISSGAETSGIKNGRVFLIRRAMFEQAVVTKYSQKITETNSAEQATPLTCAINSSGNVLVMWMTNVQAPASRPEFEIKRENAGGGGLVSIADRDYEWGAPDNNIAEMTDGVGTTDADTVPVFGFFMDPAPGDVEYTVYLGKGVTGPETVHINCRDDGSDGFEGFIAALELNLATDT